jgi:antitoxin ParD1/3/4
MNISLPAPLKSWVIAQKSSGKYSNASDYVRELIRRDQERVTRLAHLQALVTEGLESGLTDLSVQDVIAQADQAYENEQNLPAH